MAPDPDQPPTVARSTLARGLRIVGMGIGQQRRWFAIALAGSVVYGVMTVATATVLGMVVADIITPAVQAGTVTAGQLWQAGGWLFGVTIVNVLAIVTRRLAANVTMVNLGAHYRREVTRQYLRLPLSWHHRHPSGQLLSNANADVEATWQVFAPLPMALGVLVMLVVGTVQLFTVDVVLALIAVTVFPLLFLANVTFQRVMSPRATLAQQLRAEVSEVAHESFEAAQVVKTLGREDFEARRFAEAADRLQDANVEVGRTRGVFEPVIEAIPTLGTLAVLVTGTARVASGALTAADVVQVAYLFALLAFPVRAFGWVLAELPRTVVGWGRVEAVLQARGAMSFGTATVPLRGAAALRMSEVTYTYDAAAEPEASGAGQGHPAVDAVSLELVPGTTTALVGPTGSGKSTLASLAVRLVDPDTGQVSLDGKDLRDLRRGLLPQVAALVSQQTFVFDDTVRGNVTLGEPFPDERVWHALQVAQAGGFVAALPQGLDTRVGERGTSLSGGQRQRLALARALVRRPRLLVLDDATSAVDPTVEQAILAALRHSRTDGLSPSTTTVLVIAYRLATITLADEVVYIERGRVVGRGRHPELLRRCPPYARLVTAYAREAAERAAIAADEERALGADR